MKEYFSDFGNLMWVIGVIAIPTVLGYFYWRRNRDQSQGQYAQGHNLSIGLQENAQNFEKDLAFEKKWNDEIEPLLDFLDDMETNVSPFHIAEIEDARMGRIRRLLRESERKVFEALCAEYHDARENAPDTGGRLERSRSVVAMIPPEYTDEGEVMVQTAIFNLREFLMNHPATIGPRD